MIIIKNLTATSSTNYLVLHQGVTTMSLYATSSNFTLSAYSNIVLLNATNAALNYTFDAQVNGLNNNMLAYCWAAVPGYSAFGSYTGNGSADGPFVYLGFRPRWVLIKASSTTDDWYLYDSSRSTYNLTNLVLYPDLSQAEATGVNAVLDFLSNGFKCRGTANINTGSITYIYAAFAENPFKYALAR